VELTRHAAETLTSARVEALIGSGVRLAPKPVDWRKGIVNAMDVLDLAGVRSGNSRTWVRGAAVRRLQGLLLADGYGPDGLTGHSGRPDGVAGPATRAHLGVVQKKHRTGRSGSPNIPDYIAGPRTWGVLAGVG
jgi:peptidoglycan hydrolase-like protein with peptidoglycan-binding domain